MSESVEEDGAPAEREPERLDDTSCVRPQTPDLAT